MFFVFKHFFKHIIISNIYTILINIIQNIIFLQRLDSSELLAVSSVRRVRYDSADARLSGGCDGPVYVQVWLYYREEIAPTKIKLQKSPQKTGVHFGCCDHDQRERETNLGYRFKNDNVKFFVLICLLTHCVRNFSWDLELLFCLQWLYC